ncbi:MAG: acyl-CoA thioesterase [Aureispira sp.]
MKNNKRALTLRFLAEPTDVNFGGKVHGGMVMKWIDQAGYACARHWSRGYCVTVYVGGIQFLKPILIGNLVEIQAKIIYTGRTSMHISIDVLAHDPKEEEKIKTTHCVIIFVAVDPDGKPVTVPTWVPETEQEKRQETYAKRLMKLRTTIQQEMENKNC